MFNVNIMKDDLWKIHDANKECVKFVYIKATVKVNQYYENFY